MKRWMRGVALASAWTGLPGTLGAEEPVALIPPATPGGAIQGRATVPAGTEWVVIFYRAQGESDFSSFNLDAQADGTYLGTMDVPVPAGTKVEYYAAFRTPSGLQYLPQGAPATFANLQLPGEAPSAAGAAGGSGVQSTPSTPPSAPPAAPAHGPVYVDGTFGRIVHAQQALPDGARTLAAGQVRVAVQSDIGDGHLSVDGRLVYADQPVAPQARWSVGGFQASYTQGANRVQVGDQFTQESEFTLSGGGRRGFDYSFTGQPAGAHLFALNTETQAGARGLFWPVAGSEVYGGAFGYAWRDGALRARVVFLSGKDDPSTALNVATAYPPMVRDGSTGALLLDGQFLQNRLSLSGEYARSLFTPDLTAAASRVADQAWRVSGLWVEGPFTAQLGYRDVGRDFGTVGVAFFVGDRRTFNGVLGWNQAAWSLSATATDERVNPQAEPGLAQAWNQTQSLDARLSVTPSLSWRVGLRQARQSATPDAATPPDAPVIPFANSTRSGVSTGLDWILPPSSSLSFNAQFDRLRGTGSSDSTGSSTTLSAGGSLALGARVRLSPSLSWTTLLNDPGSQRTTVSNAFLNGEFSLVPGALSFLLNGGVSRTALSTGETLNNVVAEGTLQAALDRFLPAGIRGSLGAKGRYTRTPVLLSPAATGSPAPTSPALATPLGTDNQVSLFLNLSY